MSEQAKTGPPGGEYSRGAPWYPLRKWWHLSQLFSQDAGLESGDACWMDVDWLQRSSWPGYIPTPLFVPYISGSTHHPSQKISKWRVIMDVAHFSPSEISLSIRDGFLEVRGKHEERPDRHGFIARCFTRKYRLPEETDATKVTSTLSADGILTVEAPVPETSVPAATHIPINVVMVEDNGEPEVKDEKEEESGKATDHPESASSEDHGEGSSLDVHRDEGQPGSATVGLQQHDERKEKVEETPEKSAGESHPSVPVGDEGTESLQESSTNHETLESQDSPDVDTSKELELQGSVEDEELQVMAGSREAAEDITQPEEQVQSQDLEVATIKQEHTQ